MINSNHEKKNATFSYSKSLKDNKLNLSNWFLTNSD